MTTQIACGYRIQATGILPRATLQTQVAAVAVNQQWLVRNGLFVLTDVTTNPAGNQILRTITLSMVPTVPATITAAVTGLGAPKPGQLASLTPTVQGSGYIKPPVLTFAQAGPPTFVPPGSFPSAFGHAQLGVVGATVGAVGAGYTAATVVTFSGGQLAPGGKQATATPTIVGGTITGLVIVTAGGPYNAPPTITITDTGGGSGAVFTSLLGVVGAVVDNPGAGFGNGATVTVNPYYKYKFPDSAGATSQGAPMANWMTQTLQQALMARVVALAPVVT